MSINTLEEQGFVPDDNAVPIQRPHRTPHKVWERMEAEAQRPVARFVGPFI